MLRSWQQRIIRVVDVLLGHSIPADNHPTSSTAEETRRAAPSTSTIQTQLTPQPVLLEEKIADGELPILAFVPLKTIFVKVYHNYVIHIFDINSHKLLSTLQLNLLPNTVLIDESHKFFIRQVDEETLLISYVVSSTKLSVLQIWNYRAQQLLCCEEFSAIIADIVILSPARIWLSMNKLFSLIEYQWDPARKNSGTMKELFDNNIIYLTASSYQIVGANHFSIFVWDIHQSLDEPRKTLTMPDFGEKDYYIYNILVDTQKIIALIHCPSAREQYQIHFWDPLTLNHVSQIAIPHSKFSRDPTIYQKLFALQTRELGLVGHSISDNKTKVLSINTTDLSQPVITAKFLFPGKKYVAGLADGRLMTCDEQGKITVYSDKPNLQRSSQFTTTEEKFAQRTQRKFEFLHQSEEYTFAVVPAEGKNSSSRDRPTLQKAQGSQ